MINRDNFGIYEATNLENSCNENILKTAQHTLLTLSTLANLLKNAGTLA